MSDGASVARSVRGDRLLCRIGLLLVSQAWLGREPELATRLNLDWVDYSAWKISRFEAEQRRIGLSWEGVVADLDAICGMHTPTDAVLVFNLDIALSYLDTPGRQRFWRFLRDGFRKRPKGLVLAVPQGAESLIPVQMELETWTREARLARVDE